MTYDVAVIGGGAAGFFAAINIAMEHPQRKIIILEKSTKVLQKVKISGGGRCNVTNSVFEPVALAKNYPRGEHVLLEPFSRFSSNDTKSWFAKQGVPLKTEADGRVFPVTDSSQTIIDCFMNLCSRHKIEIVTSCDIVNYVKTDSHWNLNSAKSGDFECKNLVIATGSSPAFWNKLAKERLNIISAVPSLFTFTANEKEITNLSGLSVPEATVSVKSADFQQTGPLLITHWGFSGPAILKLSASAALFLNEKNYNFELKINWLSADPDKLTEDLKLHAAQNLKKNIYTDNPTALPSRLWKYQVEKHGFQPYQNWAETGKKHYQKLANFLTDDGYKIIGKSTFKDEFVTAGGVDLDEVELTTFAHKADNTLFFAGEVLNIDAFTGGFNFQAAWTIGWIVSRSIRF